MLKRMLPKAHHTHFRKIFTKPSYTFSEASKTKPNSDPISEPINQKGWKKRPVIIGIIGSNLFAAVLTLIASSGFQAWSQKSTSKKVEESETSRDIVSVSDELIKEKNENTDLLSQMKLIKILPKMDLIIHYKYNSDDHYESHSNILKGRLSRLQLIGDKIERLRPLSKNNPLLNKIAKFLDIEKRRIDISEKFNTIILLYKKKDIKTAKTVVQEVFLKTKELQNLLVLCKDDLDFFDINTHAMFIKNTNAASHNIQGIMERENGEKVESIRSFDLSLESLEESQKEDAAIVIHNKAFTYNDMGRPIEAIVYHCIAHDFRPNKATFLNGLSFGLHRLGEYRQSYEKYTKLLQIDHDSFHDNSIVLTNRAWVLLDMNILKIEVPGIGDKARAALADCDLVLQVDPRNRYARYYRAISQAHLGNKDDALKILQDLRICFESSEKRVKIIDENIKEIQSSKSQKILVKPCIEYRYPEPQSSENPFKEEQNVCQVVSKIRSVKLR